MSARMARSMRWLLAWCLIAQQLLIGAGIPLPSAARAANRAERYPCENCGCGCQSAEECWRHCCCLTNLQKVAWAKQHGVALPAFVAVAAMREAAAEAETACPQCAGDANLQSEVPSHTAGTRNDPKRSDDDHRPASGVSFLQALGCHGSTMQFAAAGPSWPGDRPLCLRWRPLPVGPIQPRSSDQYFFSPPAPPTPPPKTDRAGTVTPRVPN